MLIVEDGSIVANANSYMSAAAIVAAALEQGVEMTEEEAEAATHSTAIPYLESLLYQGWVVDKDQSLLFPREGVYYRGYLLDSDSIPERLLKAQVELCIAKKQGYDITGVQEQQVTEERFGPFGVKYAENSSSIPILPKVDAWLEPLLSDNSGNGIHMRVERGY